MNFDNYIFDFDGTLADSKQCSIEATKEAFAQFGLTEPSDSEIIHYMGIPIEKSFIEMSDRFLSEEALDQLIQLFREQYQQFEARYLCSYSGIAETLDQLSRQNKQMFVVSSKKTNVLQRNLEHLGLSRFIKEAIGSDKVKHYKPDPDGLQYILQNHNLNPANSIYIGDAIFDIQMAKAAGIKSCAVTWGSHSSKDLISENPDYVLSEVDEIIRVL
ncbi:HAD family hydrolase [Staphylococcus pasteuri]|uniref:HAD family hydrolase n=1 Tax=Staphylococcus pasteuri TaxID=45972 RepID=UPI000E3A0797|nr:HAD family hydrolase [Staphylococcus pasteuri]RFD72062.1 haloacid dehalogenase [Staphylococcus pasteuri]